MSLPSPRTAAASRRAALLLTAFAVLICIGSRSFVHAQDVPAAPAPQAAPIPAQPQLIHLQDYSKPRPALPSVLQPYRAQDLPQPNLAN